MASISSKPKQGSLPPPADVISGGLRKGAPRPHGHHEEHHDPAVSPSTAAALFVAAQEVIVPEPIEARVPPLPSASDPSHTKQTASTYAPVADHHHAPPHANTHRIKSTHQISQPDRAGSK